MAKIITSFNILFLVVVTSALGVDGESCIAGEFLVRYTSGGTKCIVCKTCPPGRGSNYDCDFGATISEIEFKKLKCVQCEEGVTYQESTSYKECSKCTVCPPGTVVISPCKKIRNTRCGSSTPKIYISSTLKPTVSSVTKPTPVETSTETTTTTPKLTTTPEAITTPESTTTPESSTTPESTTTPKPTTTPENSEISDGDIVVLVFSVLFIVLLICGGVLWWCRRRARGTRNRLRNVEQGIEEQDSNSSPNTVADAGGNDIEMQEVTSTSNLVADAGGNDIEMQEVTSNSNLVADAGGNDIGMQERNSSPSVAVDVGDNGLYGLPNENTTLNIYNEENYRNDPDYELKKKLTIEDLTISDIRELSAYLGVYNKLKLKYFYILLAENLLNMPRKDLIALRLHNLGGGCPADTFLESLFQRKANSTVKDLQETLTSGSFPESARNVLNEIPENFTLLQIPDDVRLELALELTQEGQHTPLNKDWKVLAEINEYETHQILALARSIAHPNSTNAPMVLIEQIALKKPRFKLLKLSHYMGNIGCNEGKQKLAEIISFKVAENKKD